MVPATTNFVLSFQFNRSMNTNFTPLVVLTNPGVRLAGGGARRRHLEASAVANDTFTTPPVTFATGMDGTNQVWVSMAQDLGGGQLGLTNPVSFVVDVTPPPNPVLSITASNSSSATVSWSGYPVPADLNGFRVYLATNSFTSVTRPDGDFLPRHFGSLLRLRWPVARPALLCRHRGGRYSRQQFAPCHARSPSTC